MDESSFEINIIRGVSGKLNSFNFLTMYLGYACFHWPMAGIEIY